MQSVPYYVLQAVITCILLLVTLFLGVASITETSGLDSGQVEDTRWSEVSSDVVKVNLFLSSVADYFV